MKILKVKKDFVLNGKSYKTGDEIENKSLSIKEIIKLNEEGFIETLTQKEIISLMEEKENEKKMINKQKKEEKKNGAII